jgi:hypothetical protein
VVIVENKSPLKFIFHIITVQLLVQINLMMLMLICNDKSLKWRLLHK